LITINRRRRLQVLNAAAGLIARRQKWQKNLWLFWIDHKVQQKTGRCDVVWGNPWHGM